MDNKAESEILRKADQGICYRKGCDKPGKSRIQLTYAKRNADNRLIQVVIKAWACEDDRGGR